jgi:twitching motility two-component system response regulator PilH
MASDTILVVDDSPTSLLFMTKSLEEKGYRVVTAVDGEEAIEKAVQEKPSVMLLDVILPKKNGFQVCRQLKTDPDTSKIKIVMVTHKDQESDRFWGMKQGADAYLTKPIETADLLENVEKFL